MCGIMGFSYGAERVRSNPLLSRMLIYANQERGRDSVGLAYHSRDDDKLEWTVVRDPRDPHTFLEETPLVSECLRSNVMLGHCRAPSNGMPAGKIDTTHPFQFGNTIGAHNGMIHNWHGLRAEMLREGITDVEENNSLDIDSKVAIYRINKLERKLALSNFNGKAAIWWIDVNDLWKMYLWVWDKELSMTKNGVYPFVFSSDKDHLLALGLQRDQILDLETKTGQLIEVDLANCTHYCIDKIEGDKWRYPTTSHSAGYSAATQGEFGFKDGDADVQNFMEIFGREGEISKFISGEAKCDDNCNTDLNGTRWIKSHKHASMFNPPPLFLHTESVEIGWKKIIDASFESNIRACFGCNTIFVSQIPVYKCPCCGKEDGHVTSVMLDELKYIYRRAAEQFNSVDSFADFVTEMAIKWDKKSRAWEAEKKHAILGEILDDMISKDLDASKDVADVIDISQAQRAP